MKKQIYHYNRLVHKYEKYRRKYQRESDGLRRIARLSWLKKRLQNLRYHIQQCGKLFRISVAGGALSLAIGLSSSQAVAQSFVERTGTNNPLGFEFGGRVSMQFADIDNDGDQDAFIINTGPVLFYRNDGSPTSPSFAQATGSNNPFEDMTIESSAFAIADIDGDGDLDFLQTDKEYGEVTSYYFKNEGTATSPDMADAVNTLVDLGDLVEPPSTVFRSIEPAFVDIDDDGDLDLLVNLGDYYSYYDPCYYYIYGAGCVGGGFTSENGKVYYYKNEGTTTSPSFSRITGMASDPLNAIPSGSFDFFHTSGSDFDRDGDQDLLVADGEEVFQYFNIGASNNPVFLKGPELFSNTVLSDPIFAFVDIDADGDEDVFVGESNGGIRFYENTNSANLYGIAGDGAVSLHWRPSDMDNLSHYNIFKFVNGVETKVGEAAATDVSFVDSNAENGVFGRYDVRTVNTSDEEFPYGSEAVVANKTLGNSIQFGAEGGYVQVANDIALRTPIGTIEFWMKASADPAGNAYSIIGKHSASSSLTGWNITHNNEALRVQIKDGDSGITNITSDKDLIDGKWHHVAFSFQLDGSGESNLYIDGVLNQTLETSPQINVSAAALRMGRSLDSFWAAFPGQLDEVRFWDYARTADEVADNYRKLIPGDTEGLLGYWSFDEPADEEKTFDGGIYGNDGTTHGGANFVGSDLNNSPVVANALEDLTLTQGFGTQTIDLSDVFSDADGDALTLTVSSSDEAILTAAISDNTLTLNEIALGTADVVVTAVDQLAGSISDQFSVEIVQAEDPEEPGGPGVVTSIDEVEVEELKIYPNPVRDRLNIDLGMEATTGISVYNLLGIKILDLGSVNQQHLQVDMTGFEPGIYLLMVEKTDHMISKRIMVR